MYPLTRFCWISAVDRTNIDFSAQYASIIHSNLTQISITAITMKPFMKNKFRFFHIAYIDYIIIHYDRLCRNESGHSLCHHLSFRCIRCKERRFSSCILLCPETQFIIGVFPDIYHISTTSRICGLSGAEGVWNSVNLCDSYCFKHSLTVEIIHLVPYSATYRSYFFRSVPKVGPIAIL